ncbi:MAG: hypothetical protein [Olavius algarvensis Gamma 1 endosymbiont]|nr:MAG: hypothetical protein [Olavius algarvensis Gamma 1 endosymbiont]
MVRDWADRETASEGTDLDCPDWITIAPATEFHNQRMIG